MKYKIQKDGQCHPLFWEATRGQAALLSNERNKFQTISRKAFENSSARTMQTANGFGQLLLSGGLALEKEGRGWGKEGE